MFIIRIIASDFKILSQKLGKASWKLVLPAVGGEAAYNLRCRVSGPLAGTPGRTYRTAWDPRHNATTHPKPGKKIDYIS